MPDEKYNGWSNYETWNVKLWLDNDEGSYIYWREEAEDAVRREVDRDAAEGQLAKRLEDYHEQAIADVVTTGFASDLLSHALERVNWYEIAESMIGEVEVEEEE